MQQARRPPKSETLPPARAASTEGERTISELIHQVLKDLGRTESLQPTVEYLQGEWFNTEQDLRVALDDAPVWDALKLPSRLKLALKKELQAHASHRGTSLP